MIAQVQEVLPTLLFEQPAVAARTLQWAVDQAQGKHALSCLLREAVMSLPLEALGAHPSVARLVAHLACRAREPEWLGDFLTRLPSENLPAVQVYRAWWLLFGGHTQVALAVLESLPTDLDGFERGFRLRLLGECHAQLGAPLETWQAFFQAAHASLSGTAQGVSQLTEACWLYDRGLHAAAWRLWAEALPLIRQDVFYSAWWRYNLGMTRLRERDFVGAERHFTELERLSRRAEARSFRACAHNGYGAARRLLGELGRALACYQQALSLALRGHGDAEDLETARWGIGLVLRLQGRADEALGHFIDAEKVQGSRWLRIEQAVCCLLMGDLEGAKSRLPPTLPTDARSRNLYRLLEAELARRSGEHNLVRTALAGLDFEHYSLPEEKCCFPALFDLARGWGFVVPLLEATVPEARMVVRVKAEGALQVWVGDREVALAASGLAAQVLVFLLERGGRTTLGELTEALFEERAFDRPRARQALWTHVKTLRRTLGWPSSITAHAGVYQLDPQAQWNYDIAELRGRGVRPRDFMAGVGREWVMETLRELENLPKPEPTQLKMSTMT